MKIFIQTKKEFTLTALLLVLLTAFITYKICFLFVKKPIVINCQYKYDGVLEFEEQKYKISYNLK